MGLMDVFSTDDMVSTGGVGYDTADTMVGTDAGGGFFDSFMSGLGSIGDFLSLGFTSSLGGKGGQFGPVALADMGGDEPIAGSDRPGYDTADSMTAGMGGSSTFNRLMEQIASVKPDTWALLAGKAMSGLYAGKVAQQQADIQRRRIDLAERKQNTAATSAAGVTVPWGNIKAPTGLMGVK